MYTWACIYAGKHTFICWTALLSGLRARSAHPGHSNNHRGQVVKTLDPRAEHRLRVLARFALACRLRNDESRPRARETYCLRAPNQLRACGRADSGRTPRRSFVSATLVHQPRTPRAGHTARKYSSRARIANDSPGDANMSEGAHRTAKPLTPQEEQHIRRWLEQAPAAATASIAMTRRLVATIDELRMTIERLRGHAA